MASAPSNGTRELQNGFLDLAPIAPRIAGPQGADRGSIFGRSGSGKSVLARNILAVYGPEAPKAYQGFVCIIDPNGNFEFPANKIVGRPDQVVPTKKHPVVLYRPGVQHRTADDWNTVFRSLFLAEDRLLTYIDEFFALEALFGLRRVEGGNYLNAYMTQGRARGKAMLSTAQRPTSIPINIIAQSEWFYVFDLPFGDDRARVASVIGERTADAKDVRKRETLGKFEFLFLGPQIQRPIRMRLVL
jgi:hypothetical protein